MDEHDLSTLLRRSGDTIEVVDVRPGELADRGRRRRRTTRLARGAALVATVAALGAGALGVDSLRTGPDPGPAAAVVGCTDQVTPRVLPSWARAGFSDPEPRMPYVESADGSIIAILWGRLSSPPSPEVNNKILWVAHDYGPTPTDLSIRAHLEGGDSTVERTVPGGPGPSIIDLPAPGCWRLDLTWDGLTDTVHLAYR